MKQKLDFAEKALTDVTAELRKEAKLRNIYESVLLSMNVDLAPLKAQLDSHWYGKLVAVSTWIH